ncbi:MAG: alpha/beta fold hydrolase [Jatrophihabitans sp.]
MSAEPVLTVDAEPEHATAIALVLHGGRSKGTGRVRANQLAVLRMKPFATSLVRAGEAHGLVVARLRYRVRGWNGTDQSPVADTRWALDQLAQRFPDAPVALVGHSMGGRTAMYTADYPTVRTVVGLAPWLEPGDPSAPLAGRRVLVLHGDGDRMTSADESASYVRQAAAIAESVSYVSIHGERHAMLRRARLWHELSTGFVLATLCGLAPEETVGSDSANLLMKALAGQASLTV